MIAATFTRPVGIDTQRKFIARRQAGTEFLLTDYHASEAPRAIFRTLRPYHHRRQFSGQPLGDGSLGLVWLAGLGDTVALAPGLMALQAAHPHARIEVVTIPLLFEVLVGAGFGGTFAEYPICRQTADAYDAFLAIERLSRLQTNQEVDSIALYAGLLGQAADVPLVRFAADSITRRQMRLPNRPRRAWPCRPVDSVRFALTRRSCLPNC